MTTVVELRRVRILSLLKFALVVNAAVVGVVVSALWLVWSLVDQLGLVEDVCELLLDIGVESCAFNALDYAPAVWRAAGLLLVVLLVLNLFAVASFNLLCELIGGLKLEMRIKESDLESEGESRERRRSSWAVSSAVDPEDVDDEWAQTLNDATAEQRAVVSPVAGPSDG